MNMQRQVDDAQEEMFLPINNQIQAPALPTPTTSWSMESMPWKIDKNGGIMEFKARDNMDYKRNLLLKKRKGARSSYNPPTKQFISEAKITAHFNGLHISSDYIQHDTGNSNTDDAPTTSGKCFSNLNYNDYEMTAKELERKLRNSSHRITLCDELKKLHEQQQKVSYLPEALFNRIEKPCTALVLWQPPPPIINIFKQNMPITVSTTNSSAESVEQQNIDDYIPDVELPPERADDSIDNNNTCNLDFNNIKVDSMDEDM